jgi:formate-nitrite transporter family protein
VKRKATRKRAARLSEKDHVQGSSKAAVTLVGYGDFACPECAKTYPTIKKIQAKMGSRLRYVFRSFPQSLENPHSEAAAEAAECASSQGKFWQMHDRMFENQGASDEVNLSRYATDVGLDLKQFRSEMRGHAHLARIQAGRREGVRSGVVEAPTFFINSRRHRSAFGLTTLLPAVQAAAGGA